MAHPGTPCGRRLGQGTQHYCECTWLGLRTGEGWLYPGLRRATKCLVEPCNQPRQRRRRISSAVRWNQRTSCGITVGTRIDCVLQTPPSPRRRPGPRHVAGCSLPVGMIALAARATPHRSRCVRCGLRGSRTKSGMMTEICYPFAKPSTSWRYGAAHSAALLASVSRQCRYFSASRAAMQPMPAAVTACR